MWAFIRSAAMDFARYGIRVNGVAPGVVDTPIAALVVHNEELAPEYLKTIPLGRFGQPVDIANAVLFLASEESSYITGPDPRHRRRPDARDPGDLGEAAEATGWEGS